MIFMPFVLKKVSSYKWPVAVEVPVDGGRFKKETFTAVFKKMSRATFSDLAEQSEDDLIAEILVGWEGVKDEDGEEVPYSKAAQAELCDDPYVLRALINAYSESLGGAPAKN